MRPTDNQDASKTTALEVLQEQVDYLKELVRIRDEELRRKDAILMTMAQRIPELEAASEPRERTETASDSPDQSTGPHRPGEALLVA